MSHLGSFAEHVPGLFGAERHRGAEGRRYPGSALQATMVMIVVAFPIVVTALLDKPLDVDLSKVKIVVPEIELPPLDFGPQKQ